MICLPCNFKCWPSRYMWVHRSKSYQKTSVIRVQILPKNQCDQGIIDIIPQNGPSSSRLRSLTLYFNLDLSQRNPLPTQIHPTYRHSHHPTGDHSSQETGTRQDPCSHVLKLIPSSFMFSSLASYPTLALYQRNPLPIQIPPTYNHSPHPTPEYSSQETGTRQDPCQHTPELNLLSLDSDHWHHTPGWSPTKGILSQFKSLPPPPTPVPYMGPLLPGDRYQTRPMSTYTQCCPSPKGILSQFKSLPPTGTPATLDGTMCPRWQGPDKTHVHTNTELRPGVCGSDHWQHTPGRPSAKGILSQFKSLPPTTTPSTLDGTTCPRWQGPDKTHAHMHPAWSPWVLD